MTSIIIEWTQWYLPRFPSVIDIFFNSIGGGVGAGLAHVSSNALPQAIEKLWRRFSEGYEARWACCFYIIGLLGIHIVALPPAETNWDPEFTFALGNESSADRPWLGKIYLLAIYDRALRPQEIVRNYTVGHGREGAESRVHKGLVVFYDFGEGAGSQIKDAGLSRVPLNLAVSDRTNIKWLKPNGLELLGETIITRDEWAGLNYTEDLRWGEAMSVELWVAPTDLQQRGPARIVSYWRNPGVGNFAIGQNGRNIAFQLRNPVEGLFRGRSFLQTHSNVLTTESQHIVAVHETSGSKSVYINGQKQDVALHHEYRFLHEQWEKEAGTWPFVFLVLFPIGFLSVISRDGRKREWILGSLGFSYWPGILALFIVTILPTWTLERPVNAWQVIFGAIVLAGSMWISASLQRQVALSACPQVMNDKSFHSGVL